MSDTWYQGLQQFERRGLIERLSTVEGSVAAGAIDRELRPLRQRAKLDVYDRKPWLFGCSQIYDHNPTPEELKTLTVAWLEHEFAEQLGLQPHAVRLGA